MKVIFFTNIPAPYRVALFNDLEKIREGQNFDFEVMFMRKTESNRQWEVNLDEFHFKYRIGNGFYAYVKGFFLHFNPQLILYALNSKSELVLGASWNNLNILFIIVLKRLRLIKNRISIWTEANYLTLRAQKKMFLRDRLRNWVFNTVDGSFVIPGQMSIKSFEHWGIKPKNVILLPNLISNKLFYLNVNVFTPLNKKPIFLIVGRLDEKFKGILNFMQSIGLNNLKKIKIRIVGEGSARKVYEEFIHENDLDKFVVLTGNLSQEDVSVEYKNADVFVLPSFSDQSPLTIVEAVNSGLPLLISERCGNHFEAIVSGDNGYTFNPFDPQDIKSKFELILEERVKWQKFSERSLQIAELNFNNDKILNNLIDKFIQNDTH